MKFLTRELKKLREEDVDKYKPLQKAIKKVSSLGNLYPMMSPFLPEKDGSDNAHQRSEEFDIP